MEKLQHNRAVLQEVTVFAYEEYSIAKGIIEAIGDDEMIDLDWDDLKSACHAQPEDIEPVLDVLNDLGVIEVDYQEGILG